MALRCMNPQVIVCDELGTPGDAGAVAQGLPPALYSLPRYTVTTRRDCAKAGADRAAGYRCLCKGRVPVRALPSRCGGAVGDAVTLLLRLLGTLLCFWPGWAAALPPLPAPRTAAASCTALPVCLHTWPSCWTHRHSPDRSYYAAQRRTRRLPLLSRTGESLSALTPPACMPDALRQEVQSSLSAAEETPRLTACAALHRLASRCEAQSAEAAEHCRTARRLWPRLGAVSAQWPPFCCGKEWPLWTSTLFLKLPPPASSWPF